MPTTTVSISYGSRTEYPTDTNLNNLASNNAKPIGGANNNTTKAVGYKLDVTIKLATTGVTSSGIITIYLVESADGGTTYTDGITITTTGDIASSLKNSEVIKTLSANANSQVINVTFDLPRQFAPKDHSLVILNGTGASFSTTGNNAFYTPITYTQA